jgi:hypothetical protein
MIGFVTQNNGLVGGGGGGALLCKGVSSVYLQSVMVGGYCFVLLRRIEISFKVSEEHFPALTFETSEHIRVPTQFYTQKMSLEDIM